MITLYIIHHDYEFAHMDKIANFSKIEDAVAVRDKLNKKFSKIKGFVIVSEDNIMVNPTTDDVEAFVKDYYL